MTRSALTFALCLAGIGAAGVPARQDSVGTQHTFRWRPQASNAAEKLRLAAGPTGDVWTTFGVHFRVDGTVIGKLSFKQQKLADVNIRSLVVDKTGHVFTAGNAPGYGPFLAGHAPDGQEVWMRRVGRVVRPTAGSGAGAAGLLAEVLAVDRRQTVYVGAGLTGCATLGDDGRQCATKKNAWNPDADTEPTRYFVNAYRSADGSYVGTKLFDRQPPDVVAVADDGAIAIASHWSQRRSLALRSPAGEPLTIAGLRYPDQYMRTFVVLYDALGHLILKREFDNPRGASIPTMSFDEMNRLWLLLFEQQRAAGHHAPARENPPPLACTARLSMVSVGPRGTDQEAWDSCFPGDATPQGIRLTRSIDDQFLVENLPASTATPQQSGTSATTDGRPCLVRLGPDRAPTIVIRGATSEAVSVSRDTLCYVSGADITCVKGGQ